MLETSRRSFLGGLAALVASPAVARSESLMQVRGIVLAMRPHRMLAAYFIATDEIMVRADFSYSHKLVMPKGGVFVLPEELKRKYEERMAPILTQAHELAWSARGRWHQYHVDMRLSPEDQAKLSPLHHRAGGP